MRTGTKIFICESQPVVVEGLIRVLEGCADLKFAGQTDEIAHAIKEISSNPRDLFLLGQPPAARSILPLMSRVHEAGVASRVVLWVNEMSEMDAFRALQMGARGVATRVQPVASFLECLRTVAAGSICIESSSPAPMEVDNGRRVAMRLTKRERQIVETVSKGMKNKQIAETLGITPGTVKVHLMHIFEKTGARNRFQLALQGPQLLRYSSEDA
jgi:two-component system nitrate/nitrite response regulator NarL